MIKSRTKNEAFVAEEIPLILVVEDDLDLRMVVASELSEHFEVLEAGNGKDGLDRALESIPDLVVTDVMMPVMDGLEMCRELKTRPETSHVPVIMLTAKSAVESQVEGLETGADDYVTKPFLMELLVVRIQNLLKTRRMLRQRFSGESRTEADPAQHVEHEFMEQAESVVKEHLSDIAFKSEEIAAALNMGVRSLQRKMKAVTGGSPAGFINDVRMKQATRLLVESPLSITEIAFDVGCEDSSNFTKAFKHQYGVTPSAYRNEHRK
jgi:DNA-binding response OmpR family regulator